MIHAIAFQVHQFAAGALDLSPRPSTRPPSCASTSNSLSLTASLASRQIRTFTPRAAAWRSASTTARSVST
jgi:hypothetical protein